jgi:hypothetical protein
MKGRIDEQGACAGDVHQERPQGLAQIVLLSPVLQEAAQEDPDGGQQ